MKKIALGMISLLIVAVFLIGCAPAGEDLEVVDEDGNIVGEAFRYAGRTNQVVVKSTGPNTPDKDEDTTNSLIVEVNKLRLQNVALILEINEMKRAIAVINDELGGLNGLEGSLDTDLIKELAASTQTGATKKDLQQKLCCSQKQSCCNTPSPSLDGLFPDFSNILKDARAGMTTEKLFG